MLDGADYRTVTEILGRYYSIVLTDSGTGMVHSVMEGTLESADAALRHSLWMSFNRVKTVA